MVVSSRRDTGGIQAPAVTFSAQSNGTGGTGWKSKHGNSTSTIEIVCNITNGSSVESCIEKNTYKQHEMLIDVLFGWEEKTSLIQENNTKAYADFTTGWEGRHYTIQISQILDPNYDGSKMLYLAFSPQLSYRLFIHDPKYFLINFNPIDFPIVYEKIIPSSSPSFYYRLALTEMEELDLPEDPCNTDPDYIFQACVRESLSSQVGCRTKWDRWSHKDIPLCTNLEQFR